LPKKLTRGGYEERNGMRVAAKKSAGMKWFDFTGKILLVLSAALFILLLITQTLLRNGDWRTRLCPMERWEGELISDLSDLKVE